MNISEDDINLIVNSGCEHFRDCLLKKKTKCPDHLKLNSCWLDFSLHGKNVTGSIVDTMILITKFRHLGLELPEATYS